MDYSARKAKRSPLPLTPSSSHGIGKCASIQSICLDLELARARPLHSIKRSGHSYEAYESMTPVLGSETARDGNSAKSRLRGGEYRNEVHKVQRPLAL